MPKIRTTRSARPLVKSLTSAGSSCVLKEWVSMQSQCLTDRPTSAPPVSSADDGNGAADLVAGRMDALGQDALELLGHGLLDCGGSTLIDDLRRDARFLGTLLASGSIACERPLSSCAPVSWTLFGSDRSSRKAMSAIRSVQTD